MTGRYVIIGTLASGGMGTIYLARMTGSAGFSRFVAIKRLHPHHANDPRLVAMLVDEARIASQLRHANIIDTLDLVSTGGAFGVVLEYVEGAALSTLIDEAKARGEEVPRPIAIAILRGMLRGLDAAHDALGADRQPLGVVHRDVSPQNVLVGVDGIPRVIDFGIAKAMNRVAGETRSGEVRGKIAYMAPEQLLEKPVTRQTDIYAAGVMTWQLLTGRLPFESDDVRVVMARVMTASIPAPSTASDGISPALDEVVLKATAREVTDRYARARDLYDALAIEPVASDEEVGAWVRRIGAAQLAHQHDLRNTEPTNPSRSIEDVVTEPTAPSPVTAAAAPKRRAWLLLPIAATIGLIGVIGGLYVTPSTPAVAATTSVAPPVVAPPPPSVVEAVPEVTTAVPRPISARPPPTHRRVSKPAPSSAPAAAPAAPAPPSPVTSPDHDLDHR